MTKITASRITEVFKLIGQQRGASVDSTANSSMAAQTKPSHKGTPKHEPLVLKSKLIQRICALDSINSDFEHKATVIMVEEILVWEFGDKVLNLSEYKLVRDNLVDTLLKTPSLRESLLKMFATFTGE